MNTIKSYPEKSEVKYKINPLFWGFFETSPPRAHGRARALALGTLFITTTFVFLYLTILIIIYYINNE